MKLLGISGTIVGSKTEIVTEEILDYVIKIDPSIETEVLNLKAFDIQFCDGRESEKYNEDTKKVINLISNADLFIIVTPIFHGTFSGAMKNVFDLISPQVMKNKVMGFAIVGNNYKHYLMVENQLKPLAGYFGAYVAPNYVFVHNEDFKDNKITNQELLNQIAEFSSEIINMKKLLQ
ncbi:NAD(P)H-dependent oxidoreductase [Neobacillus sp. 114]|uniref:NADPH-dependent FMN reductase n=1 Tax=Neobacillus sp. 114 TaxID=3048535 RepID=UPI0024C44743|nr:NAD(P)H-dependent oxidoreductase [Neobacillus sp. 114]